MVPACDKALKKAVIKACVMLWYGNRLTSRILFKTYMRKGKEKSAVTWAYESDDGEPRFGILLAFANVDDLENVPAARH